MSHRSRTIEQHPHQYELTLGLDRSPFETEPDPSFYVLTDGLEQRLNMLLHLVRGQEFIILVIGEKGSGKTTLMQHLLDTTGLVKRRIVIRAYPKMNAAGAKDLTNLHNRPAWILQDQHTPIVLIDDAHELTRNELLYLLQNTINPNNPEVAKRLIMFCEPKLKSIMSEIGNLPEGKTPINTVYIPPLTLEDTRQYIEHRMRTAGLKDRSPFSQSQVKRIFRLTDGLPAKINRHAHSWLLHKYAKKPLFWRLMPSHRPLLMTVAAIGLIALGVVYGTDRLRVFKSSMTKADNSPTQSQPAAPVQETNESNNSGRSPAPPLAKAPVQPDPQTVLTSKNLQKTAQKPADPIKAESTSTQTPISTELSPPANPHRLSVHREDWLMSQHPDYFTIQILGVRNEKALWQFLQDVSLPRQYELAYYQTDHNGRPWYPLVYGVFPSKETASQIMKEMPQKIQKRSPWIRSIASVQTAIRNRR